MSRRRVVVTGMGMLSPLGTDVPSSWQGILAGRSGIGPIEHMDLSAYSTRFGGSVKGPVSPWLPTRLGDHLCRRVDRHFPTLCGGNVAPRGGRRYRSASS